MKKTLVVAAMFGMAMSGAIAQQVAAPAAPAVKDKPFPPVNPKNFTAASPTPAEVDTFLMAIWGYDQNRIWQVAAVEKTAAPGVAKVVVFVADKTQPGKAATTVFFTTPDGKHAIAGQDVMAFGTKPFADTRVLMEQQANGSSRGAKSKDLELVEFADLQCPHCKEAQDIMDQLSTDFPQAHIVFENYPISEIHPYALDAATEGVCVRKAQGDEAFFVYAKAVFDTQGALTGDSHQATLDSAVMRAGADPKSVAACAATPAVKEQVEAERKLGEEIGVNQTPMLVVNGHVLPVSEIPYETLKKIVAYQAEQDGVQVKLQPTLSNLK